MALMKPTFPWVGILLSRLLASPAGAPSYSTASSALSSGGVSPGGFFVAMPNGPSGLTISAPVGNLFYRWSQP